MYSKEVLAIIPARGGSKGVYRKNVRLLGDKPLIAWTIDEAKKSKNITKIIVSTDDHEIGKISERYGAQVIWRPKELSEDSSPTIDAVNHALDFLTIKGYVPDFVILLQCTSPFRTHVHMDEAISLLIDKSSLCDSVVAVAANDYPPYWLKRINDFGMLDNFIAYDSEKYSRRQDFEPLYRLNGAIYVSKLRELLQNHSFYSCRTCPYIMDEKSSIDIDTEADFEYAQNILIKHV